MKTFISGLVLAGLVVALPVKADSIIYNGTISPSTLGGPVTTTLPMFNSTLGTLTGVQVTLDFTVTPYASVGNFSSSTPLTFTPADSIIFSFSPADIWTVSYGTDSWTLSAPTVSTGTIYGSGQAVPYYFSTFTLLQLVGSTSAAADLTAASSGLDLGTYTGAGDLVFGTSGSGQVSITDGGLGGSGGGNLTGTASVTYDYAPVPEPSSFGLLFGGLSLLVCHRARRRNLPINPSRAFTDFRG